MSALKFLVVDDATFIRDMVKKNLRDHFHGCEVFDAANGRKAQVALKANRVDLILCDWEMPEMTGEEFLLWLREQPQYADLPFIMVTSRGERDFIVKAVQAGVSDYIGKPFKPETLIAKVGKALQKAGVKFNEPIVRGSTQGITGASINILTAGAAQMKVSPVPAAPASESVGVLTGAAAPVQKPPAASKPKTVARGQAQLHFAGFTSQCVIKDISLQMLSCVIKREQQLPAILDAVVISIVGEDDEVARLNGYVHSITAGENRIDAATLKMILRFVDDDPQKLEHLSRYIEKLY